LRNSNIKHLISTKFDINNAPSIINQNVKFQFNLSTQTIARVAFVRSPQRAKYPVLSSRTDMWA